MAIEGSYSRSRRTVLAAAAGGIAGLAAGALARPGGVLGTTGDPVLAGGTFDADLATTFRNTASGAGVAGVGSYAGVTGDGMSGAGRGVLGRTDDTAFGGVEGFHMAGGTGVFGVSGSSPSLPANTGVFGFSDAETPDTSRRGVYGRSVTGQGVRGEATTTGIGVYATAPLTGVALEAAGKVKFSRSGDRKSVV